MSAVDEIEAAIAKLTAQREASLEGPWTRTDELWEGAGRYDIQAIDGLVTSDGDGIGSIGNVAEADLIVTLHRTIDAQLDILSGQARLCRINTWSPSRGVLDLARAINGATS